MTRQRFSAVAALLLGLTLVACRGENSSLRSQTEGYEVVDEGSASAANSTILGQAPGSTAPTPIPPLDTASTNIDTTTAFTTLDPVIGTAAPGTQPPGTLAETLPPIAGARPVSAPPSSQPIPPVMSRPAGTAPTPSITPRPTPTIDIRRSEPQPTPSPTVTPEEDTDTAEEPAETPTDTTSTAAEDGGGPGNANEDSGF